ncbi:MAG: UDP-N-acetylmuramate dehydrogenase, partial [Halanaerobiales bacterium]
MPAYNKDRLVNTLNKIKDLKVKTNIPLKNYTSFKVGGPADIFSIPKNIESLQKLLRKIKSIQIPVFILGKGTNIIAGDKGYRGIIIYTGKLNNISINQNQITAESGISLSSLANKALENNLSGLEFASGIPGSLGGALCMNAGAYGHEMKDIVTGSTVFTYSGKKKNYTKEKLNLSYRHSIFQEKPLIAVKITLNLIPGNFQDIKKRMTRLNKKRKEKQPLEWPSAGSIFKRPPDNYAGALIEKTGMKGLKIGGAQ